MLSRRSPWRESHSSHSLPKHGIQNLSDDLSKMHVHFSLAQRQIQISETWCCYCAFAKACRSITSGKPSSIHQVGGNETHTPPTTPDPPWANGANKCRSTLARGIPPPASHHHHPHRYRYRHRHYPYPHRGRSDPLHSPRTVPRPAASRPRRHLPCRHQRRRRRRWSLPPLGQRQEPLGWRYRSGKFLTTRKQCPRGKGGVRREEGAKASRVARCVNTI